MSSVQYLREFIKERLTAVCEEIFSEVQKTIVQYEEEINRQHRLLDISRKPDRNSHIIDLPQNHDCEEEEGLDEQQVCNQERNSSLVQEDPEPPQIKEEQEELCSSQEGEQLGLKQESEGIIVWTGEEQLREMEIIWKPVIKLHKIDLQQQDLSEKDGVLTDQLVCNQERNSSLDQEDPEPPHIKEEQEELFLSLFLMMDPVVQGIQEREKDVKLLQQEVEAINGSADKAVEDSEKMFTELIRLIQKRSSDVKQQVRSQQETEVSRVKELQEKLEQEIAELKRKDGELEQLSHTEDHNQFLHNYPSLSALSESTHSSSINIRPLSYFEDVTAAVSETRDKLQDILRKEWTNISLTVTEEDVLLSPAEPKTRAEFLKYSHEITLDPNTANMHLLLSEGNRKATQLKEQQCYSDHSDRFTFYDQVEWRGAVEE
nr:tripartite motif-containing protein 16-like [Maylandia zebra]